MGGACVELVLMREMVFEGDSCAVSAGAEGAVVEAGASTEQGGEVEIAGI